MYTLKTIINSFLDLINIYKPFFIFCKLLNVFWGMAKISLKINLLLRILFFSNIRNFANTITLRVDINLSTYSFFYFYIFCLLRYGLSISFFNLSCQNLNCHVTDKVIENVVLQYFIYYIIWLYMFVMLIILMFATYAYTSSKTKYSYKGTKIPLIWLQ